MKELDFRLSRSYGPGRYDATYEERGHEYPIGYVRWSEKGNLQEFLRLLAIRAIDVRKLTTHRFGIDDAKSAYALIAGGKKEKRDRYIGVLLDYGSGGPDEFENLPRMISIPRTTVVEPLGKVTVGFLGAGNFAQGFLLPNLQQEGGTVLVGVCTGNGLNAANVARNFGFDFATTEPKEILENTSINTVFIASRHNLHARYAIDALKAGKHVFVEKPLALSLEELKQIRSAYDEVGKTKSPIVLVGFNRRFSPHCRQVKRFFENAVGPFVINYRVNAGLVPITHWTRDLDEGGGRIIGEVCHFVDLMQYVTESRPVKVFTEPLSSAAAGSQDDDSVIVTLKFEDGSIGTITYLANGDPSMPKERVEISSTSRSAIIDNFQYLTLYQQGRKRDFKLSAIEKGHREEVHSFLQAIQNAGASPISFESLTTTSIATFKIVESLRVGVPVSL